ncbi:Cthe_2314 family HEPN domain-containing protein [Listeria cornellensis]|uniref:Cthe-2314-like HEPN domain-containing protein n=1 Tax=Listeria cornellensis FSL F6-0969 TaxID=1265820 RepID=W7BX89_9LIST|nr:Cthe_2314 family HEPN domain-containing protein [Listeria cornellensis]EUJ31439.1 hypothetical protein PCORN_05266 [Listeria cornellensis FSL F6-0969]
MDDGHRHINISMVPYDEDSEILTRLNDLDSWLKSINQLIKDIHLASNFVIDPLENDELWDLLDTDNSYVEREINLVIIYHFENLLYRTVTLWDLLAQFINRYYCLGTNMRKVTFKNTIENSRLEGTIDSKLKEIKDIITQYTLSDASDEAIMTIKLLDFELKIPSGIHAKIRKMRNNFTHKLNDSRVTDIYNGAHSEEFEFHVDQPPLDNLNEVLTDFVMAVNFLRIVIDDVRSEQKISRFLSKYHLHQ